VAGKVETEHVRERRRTQTARSERRDDEAHRRSGVRPVAAALVRPLMGPVAVVEEDDVSGAYAGNDRVGDVGRAPPAAPVLHGDGPLDDPEPRLRRRPRRRRRQEPERRPEERRPRPVRNPVAPERRLDRRPRPRTLAGRPGPP
jgi:hypothetical protein